MVCVPNCLSGLLLAAVWGLVFRTTELPRAMRGVPYDAIIRTVVDGRCPASDVELSMASGALPAGLHLISTGISGVPREMGHFHFAVRAENQCRWVIQEYDLAVTGRPLLVVSPDRIAFEFHEGDAAPQRKQVLVSGAWPDLAYEAAGLKPWLKLAPLAGRTPPDGSPLGGDELAIEVSAADLAPGSYTAKVNVAARDAAVSPSVEVTVTVLQKQ